MKRHDFSELAALYSLDILDGVQCRAVEDASVDFPDLELELVEFRNAFSAIGYSAPTVPLATDLKARLFARIAEDASHNLAALKQKAANVKWQPYPLDGVTIGTLHIDSEKREISCFVRSIGAVNFPKHQHAGDEEIVVLEGDLVIDGQKYSSGDRIISHPNTIHQPTTQTGCLLFLKTSLDDEIFI